MRYPKIQGLYKRNEETHKFIVGEYSLPEFDYLKDNTWEFTEKIDGTNIRIYWNPEDKTVIIKGRNEKSNIPEPLVEKLKELFPKEKFEQLYTEMPMTLYGEGYGFKIQKGGKYRKEMDFILFDILIDKYWLQRDNVEDIAQKLMINIVPVIGEGTLEDGINLVKKGLISKLGKFEAEGIVCKTKTGLIRRNGQRVITKIKVVDWE